MEKRRGEKKDGGGEPKRQRTTSTPLPVSPEELIPAAKRGDAATVASALHNPLTDPNMTDEQGNTALMLAAY